MLTIIINLVLHNLIWFACVVGAARGHIWIGAILSASITTGQIIWFRQQHNLQPVLIWTAVLTCCGFIVDSSLAMASLIHFAANPYPIKLAPPWIIAIWLNFSVVMYMHFRAHFDKLWLLSILALICFPLAYAAGVKLGAAALPDGYRSLLWLGLIWAIILPAIVYILRSTREKGA